MSAVPIEADYLVIGAGATAMAFVDTLLSENTDATAVMVDRQHRPGGHWNNAYPFVRLHQPSEYYGVASRELSHGIKDTIGFNAGLYGLASGAQVLACFDQVMQPRFLTSGPRALVCDVGICHRPGRQTPGPLTHQRQQPADHGAVNQSPQINRPHGVYRRGLGQDRHGRHPVAAGKRRAAFEPPLGHVA